MIPPTRAKPEQRTARRNGKESKGSDGIEIVDALFGAVQVDKLSNTEAVVLLGCNDRADELRVNDAAQVVVDPLLEDLAGNNLRQPFEVDR